MWQGAKKKAEVERYSHKARLYYEHNPKVRLLLEQIDYEVKRAGEAKRQEEKAAERAKLKKTLSEYLPGIILILMGLGMFYFVYLIGVS